MKTCNKINSLPSNLRNQILNRLSLKSKAAMSITAIKYKNEFKEFLKKEKLKHLKEKQRIENQIRFQNERKKAKNKILNVKARLTYLISQNVNYNSRCACNTFAKKRQRVINDFNSIEEYLSNSNHTTLSNKILALQAR